MRLNLVIHRISIALLVCFAAISLSAQRVAPARRAGPISSRALSTPRLYGRTLVEPTLTLPAAEVMARAEIQQLNDENARGVKPHQIGFTRPTPRLQYTYPRPSPLTLGEAAPNAVVEEVTSDEIRWLFSVQVLGAKRLRVHLKDVKAAAGATVWTWASGTVPLPVDLDKRGPDGDIWTPAVAGDRAYVEVDAPRAGGASLYVDEVMQIFAAVDRSTTTLAASPNGTQCMVDAACVTSTSTTLDMIADYRDAVAMLEIIDAGKGYTCTGALVNDAASDPNSAYMLTSNHCISNPAAAATLEAYWLYTPSTCGTAAPSKATLQRSAGAQLMVASALTDVSLVRLNVVPSTPHWYLGSSTLSTDVSNGTTLYRVSHPFGGTQSYSQSTVTTTSTACSTLAPRPQFIYSSGTNGTTAEGSNGAPVLIAGGYIVGQLWGKCGSNLSDECDNVNNYIVDGALSESFSLLEPFIYYTVSTAACVPDSKTGCLLNGRFKVKVRYRNAFDNNAADTDALVKTVTGFGSASYETGFFYFNSPNNIEIMVKVLDQGVVSHPYIDVLFGSATPLRTEMEITDTKTGIPRHYISQFGSQAGSSDFTAFVK
jgi:hypothetical protein